MSGKGFARRVTLKDLGLFSPLLGKGKSRPAMDESTEGGSGAGTQADSELAAAERLFGGTPFKTGMRFNYERRDHERPKIKRADNASTSASARDGHRAEELLMRVRPRRDGKQLQLSLIVLRSEFMNNASRVVAASSGTVRQIGFDHTNEGTTRNLARFEAAELDGMKVPVARFRWIKGANPDEPEVLRYEIFDAATSEEGKRILELLEAGIGAKPNTKLRALGHTETVLSKNDREIAQWYRLNPLS